MKTDQIPACSVKFLINFVLENGIPLNRILHETGLHEAWFNHADANLLHSQYLQIVRNCIKETKNPALGLTLGQNFRLNDYGLYGYAVMSSPTMNDAVQVMQSFWALSGSLLNTDLIIDGEMVCFNAIPAFPLSDILVFAMEELLSIFYTGGSFMLGIELPITQILLSYSKNESIVDYNKEFGCPVYYESKVNQIHMPVSLLNQRLCTGQYETFELLKRQCEEMLNNMKGYDELILDIRRLIINSPGNFPKLDDTAGSLGFSSRTLRRYLKEKNTTYQKILDGVKEEIAKEYLTNTNLSIDQISDLIGFSETTTFRRTFKKWTGVSATDYRKQISFSMAT